jgi:hypothetical protein
MAGIALTAVFGFVAYIISYGIFVPSDLKSFNLIAAVASMVGYALGNQVQNGAARLRIALIVANALLCVTCIVAYVVYVQRGSGDVLDVALLAVLLFCIFFSLTFVMPIAGLAIGKPTE